jgi:hypothetical protein
MALFRKGLAEGSRVAEIQEIRGGVKAVEVALHQAGPGQLILIQPDKIDETLDYVRQYVAHRAAGNEIDLNSALATAQPAEALAGEVID